MSSVRFMAMFAVAVLASGCVTIEPADSTSAPATPTRPTPSPLIVDPTALTYDQVMAIAVGTNGQPGDIDRYWRRTLPTLDVTATFDPPSGFYPYRRGVEPANACADALVRNAY